MVLKFGDLIILVLLDVEPFSQTYARYSPTSKTVEIFISRKRIKHNGDQALSLAVGNVVWKPMQMQTSIQITNNIDPAVAFLTSLDWYLLACLSTVR